MNRETQLPLTGLPIPFSDRMVGRYVTADELGAICPVCEQQAKWYQFVVYCPDDRAVLGDTSPVYHLDCWNERAERKGKTG